MRLQLVHDVAAEGSDLDPRLPVRFVELPEDPLDVAHTLSLAQLFVRADDRPEATNTALVVPPGWSVQRDARSTGEDVEFQEALFDDFGERVGSVARRSAPGFRGDAAYIENGPADRIPSNVAIEQFIGDEPRGLMRFVWQRAAHRIEHHRADFGLTPDELASFTRDVPTEERDALIALADGAASARRSLGLSRALLPGTHLRVSHAILLPR